MDITKYTGLFHDGEILNIIHTSDNMEIWIESNQIRPEWNPENIPLSDFQTIREIIYIKKIKNIFLKNILIKQLKIIYDCGEISEINIYDKKVELFILWNNYPPKPDCSQFDQIIIEAEYIEWENCPELARPMDN